MIQCLKQLPGLGLAVTALCLTGCNTMGALQSAGDEAKNGNVLTALFLVVATPAAMVTDVFTLGGTVSSQKKGDAAGTDDSTSNDASIKTSTDTTDATDTSVSSDGVPLVGGGSSGGNCRTTMAFMAQRIPEIHNQEINSARTQVLGSDIVQAMRAANGQGYTPQLAIQALLDQARADDVSTQQALRTASAVDAFGQTDDQFLAMLKAGTLRIERCEGIRNNALCSAALTKIGAIANRAMAAEMQCHLRAGTWPRQAARAQTSTVQASESNDDSSAFRVPGGGRASMGSGSYDPDAVRRQGGSSTTSTPVSRPSSSGSSGPIHVVH